MTDRCPSCASTDVREKSFGFGDRTLYEKECQGCGLFEYRHTLEEDYAAWEARWWGPSKKVDKPIVDPAAKKAAKKAMKKAKPRKQPEPPKPPPPPPPPAPDPRDGFASDGRPLAEIFAEIVARPHEDWPRLAYADAIADRHPVRADWIRDEIERFRAYQEWGPRPWRETGFFAAASPGFEHPARTSSFVEQMQRAKDRWGEYMAPHARARYRNEAPLLLLVRGFVAHLCTDPAVLLDPAIDIFNMAPIEHLVLTDVGDVHAAIASPRMAQLRELELRGLGLGDADMAVLVREGHLACCEQLDLRNNKIGPVGVATLVASQKIRLMRDVRLDGNPGDPTVQYSYDCHGTIADMWLPATGKDAEQKYGRIDWLHPLDDMGLYG